VNRPKIVVATNKIDFSALFIICGSDIMKLFDAKHFLFYKIMGYTDRNFRLISLRTKAFLFKFLVIVVAQINTQFL
jgi:hypothetical protein